MSKRNWVVTMKVGPSITVPGDLDVTTKDGVLIFTDAAAPFGVRAAFSREHWQTVEREA